MTAYWLIMSGLPDSTLARDHCMGQLSRARPSALRLSTPRATHEREAHAGVPLVRGGVHSMGQTARRIDPA